MLTRWLTERELPARLALAGEDLVLHADAGAALPRLPGEAFDLVYIDPPWNTGRRQEARRLRSVPDPGGTAGFAGRRYRTEERGRMSYADSFADHLGFLAPKLAEARRVLAPYGTLYVHLDPRSAYRVRPLLDEIFGPEAFLAEIVWAYDYGAKPKDRWPPKHDTILVYVKTPGAHLFRAEDVEREPYMAPGLVTPEKAARGKLPTDVWWHTIVPTRGSERTGYPSQKPEGVLRRVVTASSNPGGWCLDFFAGSGTLGAVARQLGRRFVLIDESPDAYAITRARLGPPTTL